MGKAFHFADAINPASAFAISDDKFTLSETTTGSPHAMASNTEMPKFSE